jgi:hypothetical protein
VDTTSSSSSIAVRPGRDFSSERGVAMLVALMGMLLMVGLGTALIKITTNYRNNVESLYAADAAVERAMEDLLTVPDWNMLLTGVTRSALVDGAPSGIRTLADGSQFDLTEIVNMANCGHISTCSPTEMDTATLDRPWGANNPRWQLYAYGRLNDVMATVNSSYYVVVLVGDDPSENDNNPLQDGVTPCHPGDPVGSCNPGSSVIALRAEAFGPHGSHKVIEVTVARTDTTELERGYTGQRGQDEQNRRARKAPVQAPGKALTNQSMATATGGIS